MRLDSDVIVVGAGPGGAVAAHDMARAGLRVHLLERREFPRDKACGDAISMDAIPILDDMDLTARMAGWFAWDRCVVTSPGGHSATCHGAARLDGPHGVVAPRTEFDQALAQAAVVRGARLWEHCAVKGAIVEGGRCVGVRAEQAHGSLEFRAPLVIAADGYHSAVARSLGLVHRQEITAYAIRGYFEVSGAEADAPAIELHFDRDLLPGYGWYFPVAKGIANVGAGILAGALEARGVKLDALFDQFLRTNPFLRERLTGARRIGRLRGAPLPMGPGPSHTIRGRCLFVGDAAGFVDAMTGEGIGAAMHTGRIAAEVVATALNERTIHPETLRAHDRRCRARYGTSLLAAYWVQRLMGGGLMVDRLVRKAAQRPALGADLFDMIAGVLPKTAALHPANMARALL